MAKIGLTASTYRVARGKAEIEREKKWQKTAKLATKRRLELDKRKPADKGKDPESLSQGKATELTEPEAPDNNKGR